jgi:hypothetical protein
MALYFPILIDRACYGDVLRDGSFGEAEKNPIEFRGQSAVTLGQSALALLNGWSALFIILQ